MSASEKDVLAELLAATLADLGVTTFYYSPGFRNFKFLKALEQRSSVTLLPVLDERGMGFAALGAAVASMKPVALVVTSGTAVANLLPAVLEGQKSLVPLIVISADRLSTQHQINSNQTFPQRDLFKDFCNFSCHLELSNFESSTIDYCVYEIKRAVCFAMEPIAGPVHVNAAFGDPNTLSKESARGNSAKLALEYIENKKFKQDFFAGKMQLANEEVNRIIQGLYDAEHSAIVIGECSLTSASIEAIFSIALRTNSIVISESSSCLAPLKTKGITLIEHPSSLQSVANQFLMEKSLYIGKDFVNRTSREVINLICNEQLRIYETKDATSEASLGHSYIYSSISEILALLADASALLTQNQAFHSYSAAKEAEIAYLSKLRSIASSESNQLSEPFFHLIAQDYLQDVNLFLGNSMVIRDFNAIASTDKLSGTRIFMNRGLSGIDGNVHTALGIALETNAPTYIFIGDLSFLHDLSVCSALKKYAKQIDFTIFVLNNGGGEIFRVVSESATELITTPFALDLELAIKSAALSYNRIESKAHLKDIFASSARLGRGVRLFEIMIDADENRRARISKN